MNPWLKLRQFPHKLYSRVVENAAPSPTFDAPAAADEVRQLDLLLSEVRRNEQQLSADHWTSLAAAFQEQLPAHQVREAERAAKRRGKLARYKNVASYAVPLGGLLAIVALIVAQPTLQSPSHRVAPLAADAAELAAPKAQVVSAPPLALASASTPTSNQGTDTGVSASVDTAGKAAITPPQPALRHSNRSHLHVLGSDHAGSVAPSALAVSRPIADSRADSRAGSTLDSATASNQALELSSPVPVAGSNSPLDTFAAQLAALKRADKALKAGKSSEARSALAREFSPQLGLHASALRVILACQEGQLTSGRRDLAAQQAQFPNSPYLNRMRRACGLQGAAR